MDRLRSRQDYLAAAKGARVTRTGFVLQAVRRDSGAPARFGFTVTNKVGNAVTRNRLKRRLRELARAAVSDAALGVDYVLVGRREAVDRPFDAMTADLASAMTEIVKMRRLAEPRTDPRGAR